MVIDEKKYINTWVAQDLRKQIVLCTTRASDWRQTRADLFAVDEQRQAVEQLVDGVPRLVDGQDDGAAVVRHPRGTKTNVSLSVWVMRASTRGNVHLLSSSSTELAVLASRPVVGSSRKSTDGLMISSMPMLVRFLSPPEIPRISWVPTWERTHTPKRSSSPVTLLFPHILPLLFHLSCSNTTFSESVRYLWQYTQHQFKNFFLSINVFFSRMTQTIKLTISPRFGSTVIVFSSEDLYFGKSSKHMALCLFHFLLYSKSFLCIVLF